MTVEKNMKICLLGAMGRMGKSNVIAVSNKTTMSLSAAIEREDSAYLGKDVGSLCGIGPTNVLVSPDLNEGIASCDVVIDFTSPKVSMEALCINENYNKGFVIGTTGFDEDSMSKIRSYSSKFPIVLSPNFSIGVNLLFRLVESASKILSVDMDYDLEIIEAHHRYKKDAPSGTALRLLDIAAKNSNRDKNDAVYGRKGLIGERTSKEIGMNVIRAGDIVGEHTVMYSTEGERVEITHTAQSRSAFSKGALMSAEFVFSRLSSKDNRLYSMLDVLNF